MPFIRKIEDDDVVFYNAIDTIPVLDQAALEQLTHFYSKYLKDNSTILDLMPGVDSHIPDNLENIDIIGLGLKEQDLKENSALNQYTLHDLNKQPELPFDAQQFDAFVCSFSVEYMVQPVKVFQQIARILKPGGVLLVGFSDRFFEKKGIGLWDDLHTFERMGIILEYFRQAGEFDDLRAESIRGLIRHNNDPFINKNVFSCPMFMLSGKRKG